MINMDNHEYLPPRDSAESMGSTTWRLCHFRSTIHQLFSILQTPILNSSNQDCASNRATSRDTEWLDGLRGFAAVVVFNFHYIFAFSDVVYIGFDIQHRNVLRLPYIRLAFDGFSPVAIFFVVSGYVCSLRALKAMHDHEHNKLLHSLCRSVFHRFFRLFMPTMVITFLTAIGAYLGMFEPLRPMIEQTDMRKKFFPGPWSRPPLERYETLLGQLRFWVKELSTLAYFWNLEPQYLHHDAHLWTIAYEIRASMYLYITLLGITLCKPRIRLLVLVTSGIIYFLWHMWEGPLFFGGAAIALVNITSKAQAAPQLHPTKKQEAIKQPRLKRLCRLVGYIFALYLMSYPRNKHTAPAPGFGWICAFIPSWYKSKDKLPKSLGALLFVYLLSTSEHKADSIDASLFHRAFASRFAQQMGRIMFSFYLVHGPIMHTVGYGIPLVVWRVIGSDSQWNYVGGLIIGMSLTFLAVAWTANIFAREVDARCVNFIRWLEKVCFE